MPTPDDKLQRFERSVLKETDQAIAGLLQGIAEQKETVLSEARDAELARYAERMQEKTASIKQDCKRRVSLEEQKANKALLLKREEISDKVFAEAAELLSAYTETKAYQTLLESDLQAALEVCATDGACVYARAADTAYLESLCGGIPVRIDRGIKLGGFIVKNERQGIAVDRTFDARLQAQHDYFNSVSELTLTK